MIFIYAITCIKFTLRLLFIQHTSKGLSLTSLSMCRTNDLINYLNTLTDEFVDVSTYLFEIYITSLIIPQTFERNEKNLVWFCECKLRKHFESIQGFNFCSYSIVIVIVMGNFYLVREWRIRILATTTIILLLIKHSNCIKNKVLLHLTYKRKIMYQNWCSYSKHKNETIR